MCCLNAGKRLLLVKVKRGLPFFVFNLKTHFLSYLYQKSQQTVNSRACFGDGLAEMCGGADRSHLQVTVVSDDDTLNSFDLQLSVRAPAAPSSLSTQPLSPPVNASL